MPLALRRTTEPGNSPTGTPPHIHETDLDRVLKLVPGELVLFYSAAAPLLADAPWRHLALALFVIGVVFAPVILYLDGWSTGQPAQWPQYAIRTLTFAACASAVAWPFEMWVPAHEVRWLRSLATLAIPFVGAMVLHEGDLSGRRGSR